jgi:hypothetical protein
MPLPGAAESVVFELQVELLGQPLQADPEEEHPFSVFELLLMV